MVDEGRLPLRFALITFTIAFGARWATKSHRSIGHFVGVNSPITGPILEGSRGYNPYHQATDLDDTALWRTDPMTRTSDPTLPSRAHPQDDVRRQATPSNYHYYYHSHYCYL